MRVKAIVTVSVTIVLPDDWADECQINQVFDQAGSKARNILANHLTNVRNITIHKEPKVEAILTENQ